MTIHVGLDVSFYDDRRWWGKYIYDRPTDWDKAETGLLNLGEFVIIKSSEALYRDPGYTAQIQAAGSRPGRPRGHYHLIRQNIDPIRQANFFCDTIDPHFVNATDIAIVDWETRDGADNLTILRNGGAFLNQMDKRGFRTGIYTYPSYWNGISGGPATGFKDYPLFIAEWHWDNWLSVLRLPPYAFHIDRVKNWMTCIDFFAEYPYDQLAEANKVYQPKPLAPWYSQDNRDWYKGWQITARLESADVPGYPAIKKVVDVNYLSGPWW